LKLTHEISVSSISSLTSEPQILFGYQVQISFNN